MSHTALAQHMQEEGHSQGMDLLTSYEANESTLAAGVWMSDAHEETYGTKFKWVPDPHAAACPIIAQLHRNHRLAFLSLPLTGLVQVGRQARGSNGP